MSSQTTTTSPLRSVAIRFAGDSGDGMQLTGARFTHETARAGNDLATKPDFPAEIRAPAGTIGGVSAFQIHFGSDEIYTAGDELDVLVAMNPAALRANLSDLKQNGTLICNSDAFTERNLQKVDYESNPLEDEELSTKYNLVSVAITDLTFEALEEVDLPKSSLEKCKNFFALGVICHMYSRNIEDTKRWIEAKFVKAPLVIEANMKALRAGQAFAEASEVIAETFDVPKARLPKGTYRNITGNQGIAFGLIAAGELSGTRVFYSGYPITPASDILHEVSRHKNFGAITLQAEDEIAACCAAVGASYAGSLGVTASSGPGILLKQETIGLAASAELPLVVINVQRAGPSTGMPTKTEQADLLNALFGRNGECPIAVIAISQPDDAFETTVEACRIALEHMTPVMLLSDGYIGNGSQPWAIVEQEELAPIRPHYTAVKEGETYHPFARDEKTLARSWALPGTPGLEHRLGGLEKQDVFGNISYDPENHERMTALRAEHIERIADTLPPLHIAGDKDSPLLVLTWGSTRGAVSGAVSELAQEGLGVAHVHLRHLNPLPRDLGDILSGYHHVLVPELNCGQLHLLLQAKFLREMTSLSKVQGQPFKVREIKEKIREILSAEQVH